MLHGSARGGYARAFGEYRLYQRIAAAQPGREPPARLVVVAIDGNCSTPAAKRQEIREATQPRFADRVIAACPDPHIERWYLADPDSFFAVVGDRPQVAQGKCVRDYCRRALAECVRRGGHPSTLGGIEFARELVEGMDLYRAGRSCPSLKAFVDDLRGALRQFGSAADTVSDR